MTTIFINEIHYDNAGGDVGEAIEIAAPAGTDLTNWDLVLYNGNDGEVYNTVDLSSANFPDAGNGVGFNVVTFPTNGLQNGSPDGIALVDGSGTVIQFLSYEGSFTAMDGPAAGQTSIDIGVSETNSTPIGESLQLSGTGSTAADFTWQAPATSTFGNTNTGQTFNGGTGGTTLSIAATDATKAEGNSGTTDFTFTVTRSGDTSGTTAVSFAVTGDVDATDFGGTLPAGIVNFADGEGSQTLTLQVSGDTDVEPDESFAVTLSGPVNGETLTTATANGTIQDDDAAVNPASLVINEILADPDATNGDANGDGTVETTRDEFVEIVNTGTESVDISGWTLADGVAIRHTFPGGTVLDAEKAIVVFAGGTPTGSFGGSLVQVASTGALGLNNGGDTVTLNDGTTDVATASYGSEGGDNQSLTLDPDLTGSFTLHSSATGANGALFSPGTQIDGTAFGGSDPGPVLTPIYDIQGSGAVSPFVNSTVTLEGIVTGDFQDGDADTSRNLGGFYVQDVTGDGNANTSDGLFVFESSLITNVEVGDRVRITGTVREFFGETQVEATTVEVIGAGTLSPVTVDLPRVSTLLNSDNERIADLEQYEGMLVAFPDTLTITEYFNYDRFGEIRLAEGSRPFQFTQTNAPNVIGFAAHLEDLARRTITLDDGQTLQNPDPLVYPSPAFSDSNAFRGGDTVTNLTGVVRFSRGSSSAGDETYRIMPTIAPTFVSQNPRPASIEDVGGRLKVVSFNVLNYFTTLDLPGNVSGPTDQDPRGADSQDEFDRQTEKLVTTLLAIDADILGLVELENDFAPGSEGNAIEFLVAQLNAIAGAGTYDWVNPGQPFVDSFDPISVGVIYKPAAVSIAAGTSPAILRDSNLPSGFSGETIFDGEQTNRAPLAVSFTEIATGAELTIAVNHFKSKGSVFPDGNNNDTLDGQGNNNAIRLRAAQALDAWLQTNPTGTRDTDYLILGDLNAYAQEDPITYLEGAGYTNLADAFSGGTTPYSFLFDGQLGTLDYAMANQSLRSQVTGATEWPVNADEADALDYNLDFGRNPGLFNGDNVFRNSDHDPLIIGLNLGAASPPLKPTPGDDILQGTTANEVIRALGGDDRVNGGGGSDRVDGNAGNDTLNGGLNSDTLLGGTGNDRVFGHAGDDRLLGQGGADIVLGGEGNDTLLGGEGNDVLAGASGQDFVKGERGADSLQGGSGNDTLSGGTGNDTLQGGLGNDLIFTGRGRDVIVMGRGQGFDTVADFTNGLDKLDLGTLRFGQLTIRQRQDDVLISIRNRDLLVLQNTRANQINAGDFV